MASASPTLGGPHSEFSFAEAVPSGAQLAQLAGCVDSLAALAVLPVDVVDDLKQKIASQRFDLVVAGQFKRGKTSLVNALIGAELLPVAVVPLTSIVTALSYGTEAAAVVVFESGESQRIALENLAEYVTERGNPNNRKGVREAHVTSPSAWLQEGVRLVDTPGVGSVYQKNTDVAHRFLPKADAVLFLLSVDQPISQAECDFLASVRQHSDRILFVLNKIDLLSEAELEESLTFTRATLAAVIGGTPRLFPLSARLALSAAIQGSEELLGKSRMPELWQALRGFLAQEKGNVLVASIARQARRVLALTRFALQLELESLTTPLDELDRKAQRFREKKAEMLLAKDEFGVLLGNDASRTLQRPLEEDLEAFKAELKVRVAATIVQRYNEKRKRSLRQLDRALEGAAIDEIRGGYDEWQIGESAALEKTFDAFCARHAAKIDGAIDELVRFASDLFAISFTPQSAGSFHGIESHFYYKFWREPPSLQILGSALVFALPKIIGARLVVNRMRQYALESVEMQAGRIRYDFSQRLDQALLAFKRELAAKVDSAIEGIETALGKAVKLRAAGQTATRERHDTLVAALKSLDEVDQRIALVDRHASGTADGPQSTSASSINPVHGQPATSP